MDQITTVQRGAAQPGLREMMGLGGNGKARGDTFAALIHQLLSAGTGLDTSLAQMLFAQTKVEEDEQEQGSVLGAQMMAELLGAMPGIQPQAAFLQQTQQQVAQSGADGRIASPLLAAEQSVQAVRTDGEKGEKTVKETAAPEKFYSVLSAAWEEKQPSVTLGVQWTDGVLRAAKELLSQKPKEDRQDAAAQGDIESLQADVDSGRFFPIDSMLKRSVSALPNVSEIADQVKTGILKNVAQGKNEFVVRLKPEGIGEIVVKLSENKEKIELSIFTTSTQTARMITNEVTALQNALRPLRAEVQQIAVVPESGAQEFAAETAMTNQQNLFQRHNTPEHRQQSGAGGRERGGEFGEAVQEILPEDGLDAYI